MEMIAMTTDAERREVARRLREMSGWGGEVDCAEWGERVLNLLYRGGEDCTDGEYYARLADLIEPSCDRDALLAQVKELEKCAWYFGLDFDVDEPLRDRLKEASEDFAGCARRIREALGVSDDNR